MVCWYKPPIIHHKSYKNLGREKWKDLLPLCAVCRNKLHNYLKAARGVQLGNMRRILVDCFGWSDEAAKEKLHPFLSKSGLVVIEPKHPPGKRNVKITEEGQPCKRCGVPVERQTHRKAPDPDTAYYFEWWFKCPNCKTIYMVESAKRYH